VSLGARYLGESEGQEGQRGVNVSLGSWYLGNWVGQMGTRAGRGGCCVIGYQVSGYLGNSDGYYGRWGWLLCHWVPGIWVSQLAMRAERVGCCVIGYQVSG
jgi:hypothetical protein